MPSFENCTGYLITENHQWVPAVNTGTISELGTPLGAEFISALGKRTFFDRGTAPREWQITAKAPWAWVKNLKALERAGAQRLYWVSPLGVHTNILPTSAPVASRATYQGLRMVDGSAVDIYTLKSPYPFSEWVPVKEGTTLFASAWQAGGSVYLEFQNATGDLMPGAYGRTTAKDYLSLVSGPAVTVPLGATWAHIVSANPLVMGGYALQMEQHGLAEPGPSACTWVTLHDVETAHSNIAFKHSPIDFSFTLKEV